jgi:hypothetical protein
MRKIAYQITLLPLALLILVISGDASDYGAQAATAPSVTLYADSAATVEFWTQNGETVDNVAPRRLERPHLVLHRNDELTDRRERTLIVEVSGIQVPPGGVTLTLKLETQHGDPDRGAGPENRIPVWSESQRIANNGGPARSAVTAVFVHEFDENVISEGETLRTPTDYYRYELAVIYSSDPVTDSVDTFVQDYAFLLENQWVAPLPTVREASAGAAPDELIVYYCDMFPIREAEGDAAWLPRLSMPDYIQSELVPAMVQAFRAQTDDWGFTWHDAWASYRSGKDAERLSVALAKGELWFHGKAPYPSVGSAGISLRADAKQNAAYDTPRDAILSTFYHELFHNLQRSLYQGYGGDGDIDGAGDAWGFFSEGTAVMATSIAQPSVEFAQTSLARHYMDKARWYLGRGLPSTGLNRSYAEMNPYHAAIYWRFLYEQCGGLSDDAEDPAAGLDIIRRALAALYSEEIVDISASTDLVGKLPEVMDQALAQASCPFKTHQESLNAFARAIYALRLESGRCIRPGTPAGCGLYDPNNLYDAPPAGIIAYSGASIAYDARQQRFPAGVQSSYGMDFVDVILDPAGNGGALTLEFYGAPEAAAEFSVQLWKLNESPAGLIPYTNAAEMLTERNADGHLIITIPAIDTTEFNRLGLIITRVDADEDLDQVGEYTIALEPGYGSVGEPIN